MRWLLPDSYKRGDGSVRADWRAYVLALVVLDAVAAVGALALSYYLRFGFGRDVFTPSAVTLERFVVLAAVVLLGWLVATRGFGLYDRERLLASTDEYSRVVQAATFVLLGVVAVDFVVESHVISRGWLLLFWATLVALDGGGRFCARRVAYTFRRRGAFRTRIIIVGVDHRAIDLARHLEGPGFEVLGFLDDFRPLGSPVGDNGWRVLGSASQLRLADELRADEVIVLPSAISWESRQAALALLGPRRFDVRILPTREGVLTARVRVSHRAHVPVYALDQTRLGGLEAAIKRSFDVIVALALLAIIGPFALLRVARRLLRGQPLFDRYRLLGIDGEPLTVPVLAGGGSRIVSKLPAVINVLRGQMSIVGPPPVAEGQGMDAPELRLMKPGLTSVAWADGGSVDAQSSLSIQLDYVRSYTIWRDLQVLWHRLRSHRSSHLPASSDRQVSQGSAGARVELWR